MRREHRAAVEPCGGGVDCRAVYSFVRGAVVALRGAAGAEVVPRASRAAVDASSRGHAGWRSGGALRCAEYVVRGWCRLTWRVWQDAARAARSPEPAKMLRPRSGDRAER